MKKVLGGTLYTPEEVTNGLKNGTIDVEKCKKIASEYMQRRKLWESKGDLVQIRTNTASESLTTNEMKSIFKKLLEKCKAFLK